MDKNLNAAEAARDAMNKAYDDIVEMLHRLGDEDDRYSEALREGTPQLEELLARKAPRAEVERAVITLGERLASVLSRYAATARKAANDLPKLHRKFTRAEAALTAAIGNEANMIPLMEELSQSIRETMDSQAGLADGLERSNHFTPRHATAQQTAIRAFRRLRDALNTIAGEVDARVEELRRHSADT